jgi:hypothetical protein
MLIPLGSAFDGALADVMLLRDEVAENMWSMSYRCPCRDEGTYFAGVITILRKAT